MSTAPKPENEVKRLEALRRYGILDTSPELAFDELVRLATRMSMAPIGWISFSDKHRVWFKSRVGLNLQELPRHSSFCAHALAGDDPIFVVEDARSDPRFAGIPLVAGEQGIRFYAGVPLTTPDGYKLGTLAVLDRQPRRLDSEQKEGLITVGHQVATQLELRRHLMGLATSVEDHKRTEDQLRTSEAFYHTLVETLPQNIFRKDVQGRFTFCNKKFCQSVGRRLEEIIGKTDFDFFPAELAAKYHRDDMRVMNTLENFETTEAHQTPSGEKLFVHVIKTALYDPVGRVIGIQGIFWDVTARKKTEQALAYERDLLRGLLDNIPDRIYFKDVESRFLRCSTSMALRLGLDDPQKVLGKTDFDFHPPELAREFFADEQRIILTGRPLISKLERQVDLEGREIWASVTKVPIYNQNGHVAGIIGISRDITRLKQTELALQQARDAALESARVKSQFLANMSHEIRTPMNAIVGMTGLLLDTRLGQEQRDFVHTIRDSTQSLLAIINDILDYAKVESGKIALEIIDFELRELIESTLEMLAETAHKKGIELNCRVDHEVPQFIRGDPGRLRQVLANLLSNGVKFTQKGEVRLRVSKADGADKVVLVNFVVQDTGIGIDAKSVPVIFEAFTQADGSTTRKYGGTGLGLAISKQLVELMGGEMGVASSPGEGSSFWFKLPFEKHAGASSPPLHGQLTLEERRVLVSGDQPSLREQVAHLLEPLHCGQVHSATTAESLPLLQSAIAAGQPYDLLILDTGQDGLDPLLIEKAKQDPSLAPTRVLALTPLVRRLSPEMMIQNGVDACLGKPLRTTRFYSCLEALFHGGCFSESKEEGMRGQHAKEVVHSNVRILVAEDNVVNQRLALMQMRKLGYLADAVGNGVEALEAFGRIRYDIILMDCQMPEMDGYEVTRRIRQAQSRDDASAPYIIALTANALPGDRERSLTAGMNDYLVKPLQMPDLESALARAGNKLGLSSPVPSPPPRPNADTLDYSILNALKKLREPNQPDPVAELIELYLKDARASIQKLETAVPQKEAMLVASSAHSLKGSSSNLGARALAAECAGLEKKAKAGDLTEAANLLLSVKSEFERVAKLLQAELPK